MFKKVDPKQSFPDLEEDVLKFWKKNKIFEKSLNQSEKKKRFNFYDGPPFATGLPHYGHILAMAIKDTVVRYKTMQGYYVPRRFGWDCHGLPVEYEVEKELKISGKPEIEEYGIDKFNQYCRKIVLRYTGEWKKTIARMGRWGDLDNAYVTMDNDYIETIWWVFKTIWDKKMVYKGFKSMPYCPRCGTPLSNFETNQGYKDNTPDPSVYIKFKVKNQKNTYLLAWTTTPWTLPGNAALAVGKNIKYVKIKIDNEYLLLAKDRLDVIDGKYTIIDRVNSSKIQGLEYEPLYSFISFTEKAHYVVLADFVSTEEGTGIVHIAPAFGEDDLALGEKLGLPVIQTVDKNGKMLKAVKPWAGQFVKKADSGIIKDLDKRGLLYKQGIIHHTYPFCWRCDTPLIYLAISTWFIKVSAIRNKLVENNQKIHWVPEHIKKGRFGKWLSEARDWAVTRNRYWGSPVPIWECNCGNTKVIGSIKELEKLGGKKIKDLHRPFIDEITVSCEKCGGKMQRVKEVFDCWFESGAMPYGQFHYPFTLKNDFKNKFPADFIAEGLDQTRGWFYTLHVLGTILFDKPAFYNCIVNGIILASDGKKLSKRLRNYPEPGEIFDHQGADGLRWFLLSSPAAVAEDVRFSADNVADIVRRNILILWNVYSFFISYADLDKWKPADSYQLSVINHQLLDKWILARLNQTIDQSTKNFEKYDLPHAIRPIEELINDLSTWYLRRSRKRRDAAFYETMHNVLINISKLIAPFAPYISESIYRNLKTAKDPESVHLCSWPIISNRPSAISKQLLGQMQEARNIVEKAHALRAEKGLKVRQPLAKLQIPNDKLQKDLLQIIADEVNVKEVEINSRQKEEVILDTKITPELRQEGIFREIVRQIQSLRKKSGLFPNDKIDVYFESSDIMTNSVLKKYQEEINKQAIVRKFLDHKPIKISAGNEKIFIIRVNS